MKVSKFLKCLQINKFLNKTALKQFAVFYPSKPNTGFTTRGNMHLNHLVVNGNTSLRSARKPMNLHRKFMEKNVTVIGRQNNMKMQASLPCQGGYCQHTWNKCNYRPSKYLVWSSNVSSCRILATDPSRQTLSLFF